MKSSKELWVAYLLNFLGFMGVAGIHRFYLGKPVSGFFYLITGGFAGIGTIVDFLTMRGQVDEANRRLYIEQRIDADEYENGRSYVIGQQNQHRAPRPEARSLEHLAFILAEENLGILTPAQLSLESGVPATEAKDMLESIVMKGFAVPGQRRNGLNVYVFQEFLSDAMRTEVIF